MAQLASNFFVVVVLVFFSSWFSFRLQDEEPDHLSLLTGGSCNDRAGISAPGTF